MGSPNMKIRLKIDDKDITRYLDEIQKNGVDININNFGKVGSQLDKLLTNVKGLKALENLNLINTVQLTDLKEIVTLLKEVNSLNKGIKINFINNGINSDLKQMDNIKNTIKQVSDFKLESIDKEKKSLKEEIELKEKLQKIEDKEFEKLYNDIYSQAEKSISKQIEIQKQLINAKENESKTLLKNLEIEEKKYKNLKMQLELEDRVKLTKTKENISNEKLEPLISREIDNLIEKENKLNEAIAERTLKNQDNLNAYKLKTGDKIKSLDENIIPKEKIEQLKNDLSNLQIGYSKTDVQKIQNDLNNLIALEQKLNKEQNSENKLAEQVYRENDSLELIKHNKQNKINELFTNDIVPKDKLIELEQELNKLDIGYKKVEIQKIEDELSKLINLEKDLKRTKDEQINSMKKAWDIELKELDEKKKFEEEFINKSEDSLNKNNNNKLTEEMLIAKKQAEEVNKVIDKNWKNIEKFRESQNNSLSEMGYKYKGLYQTEEIDNFRKELSKLSPISETLKEDIDKLAWKIKDFKHELSTRNDMYKLGVEITGLNNGIGVKSSQEDIQKLIKQIGGYNAEIQKINSTPILKNGNEIRKINYRVKEGKDKWHEYQLSIIQAVDSGRASLRNLDKGLKDVEATQQGLIWHLKKAWTSVVSFAGVTSVFYGVVRSFKTGLQSIIELDSAIIDLKKVTDESAETYKNFTHVANETAIAIGHTTKSAIDSTTEFAKLGFTLSEASKLAKEALIYSNIGDIDIDSATKSITSTLKGFNMNADETRHIIDAYNEVGNKFAITTGGIGEALQRSASSLHEANNTFEQSVGLVTAANDSVQDAEKVGNALKTISMRLRGISEEDGKAIPKLREDIKSITDIDIMKDENTFKSTYDILVGIASKWNEITDKDRATLIEKIAGKHQGNVMASLMNNIKDAKDATETAIDSMGSAEVEQEKYMESINARINRLKETIVMFWNDTINSDSVKHIIDMGTGIVELLDILFNKTGYLNLGFTMLNSTILISISKYRNFITNLIHLEKETNKVMIGEIRLKDITKQLSNAFQVARASGNTFRGSLTMLKAGLKSVKASAFIAKVEVMALQAVMTMGISWGITKVFEGISKLVSKSSESISALKELNGTFQDNTQQNEANIKTLSQMSKEYETLRSKTHLSSKEQEKMNQMNENLTHIFPELISGYDEQGNAIVSLTGKLSDYIEKLKQKNKEEAQEYINKGEKDGSFKEAFKQIKNKQKELNTLNNGGSDYYSEALGLSNHKAGLKQLNDELKQAIDKWGANSNKAKKIQEQIEKTKEKIQKTTSEISNQKNSLILFKRNIVSVNNEFNGMDQNSQKFIGAYVNNLDISKFDNLEKLKEHINNIVHITSKDTGIKEIIENINKLNKETKSGDISNYDKDISHLLNELTSKLNNIKGLDKDILSKIFKIDLTHIKDASNSIQKLGDSIEEANEKFKSATQNLEFYKKAIKEIDEKGNLSSSTTKEILEKHEELIPYLLKGNDVLYSKLNELMIKDKKTANDSIVAKLMGNEDYYKNTILSNKKLVNLLKLAYGDDFKNFKNVANAKIKSTEFVIDIIGKNWNKYYKTEKEALDTFIKTYEDAKKQQAEGKYSPVLSDGKYTEKNYEKAKAQKQALEELEKTEKTLNEQVEKLNLTEEKNTKLLDENKEKINAVKHALKDLELQIKNLDYLLHKQENRMKHMVKGSAEYRKAIQEETKLLKEKVSLMNEGINVSENGVNSLSGLVGSGSGHQVVELAKKYLGTPYVWGGTTPNGFDCSGLVQYVYKQLGIEINRVSQDQIKNGRAIAKNQLQEGDLVFFGNPNSPHHVGIYAGNGKYLHAPKTGDVVKISDLNARGDYAGGRRIIDSSIQTTSIANQNISSGSLVGKLGGVLNGHENDFIKAGQKYGVDPYLLASITKLESGNGTSPAIRNHNNPSGIMDKDTNWQTIKHFNSLQEAIDYTAKNLKNNYIDKGLTTIAQIGGKYAPVGASNDPNGTNKDWIPSVTQIYKELSGKNPTSFGGISKSDNSLLNEIESLHSKADSYKNGIIDIQDRIGQESKLLYDSYIEELENSTKVIDDKIKKTQLLKDVQIKDNYKYIQYLKEESKYSNDKIVNLQKEKEFVDEQLKNNKNKYSADAIFEMKQKSRDLGLTIQDVVKTVKDVNFSWVDSQMSNINQRIKENTDMINNELNRLENSDFKDLGKQFKLKQQLVELDKQNVEEITKLMNELNEEQVRTHADYLYEKIKELNGQLDEANVNLQQSKKAIEEIKNNIANVIDNIEEKIKQIIKKNNELYKESLEKNLKLFEKAVDEQIKKLDEAEKRLNHNKTEKDDNEKVFEIQQKLNRLEMNDSIEAKEKKLQLEKELNKAIIQQKENRTKYDISSRKDSLQKAKDEYNKQLQYYNKKLDEITKDRNLSREAHQSLMRGYIVDAKGTKIRLEEALKQFEDNFGKGLSSIGNKIKKELINNLNQVKDILKSFGTLDTTKMLSNFRTKEILGTGIDIENHKHDIGILGNKFTDVDKINKNKITLDKNKVVLGSALSDRHDLNGATLIKGKNRYETRDLIRLSKDISNNKINGYKGNTVYAKGYDLISAQNKYKSLGYNFVDLDSHHVTKDMIKSGDIVIGSKDISGLNFDVQNRIYGKNRKDTELKMQQDVDKKVQSLIKENYKKGNNGTVYGFGADIENARNILSKFGYNFVNTNNLDRVTLKPTDIVVGGFLNNKYKDKILNVNATPIYGKDRNETKQKIKKRAEQLENLPINEIGYSSGGVNTSTGLAMLHGKPNNPEVVLNNAQATNLFNFIKNLPYNISNSIPNFNVNPKINSLDTKQLMTDIKNIKGDTINEYNIELKVNSINGTKDEAKNFADMIMNEIRKKG